MKNMSQNGHGMGKKRPGNWLCRMKWLPIVFMYIIFKLFFFGGGWEGFKNEFFVVTPHWKCTVMRRTSPFFRMRDQESNPEPNLWYDGQARYTRWILSYLTIILATPSHPSHPVPIVAEMRRHKADIAKWTGKWTDDKNGRAGCHKWVCRAIAAKMGSGRCQNGRTIADMDRQGAIKRTC